MAEVSARLSSTRVRKSVLVEAWRKGVAHRAAVMGRAAVVRLTASRWIHLGCRCGCQPGAKIPLPWMTMWQSIWHEPG
ncbi:hypothetical protein B296_00045740 [Ensete ventricosum]|uniref:Uncharacterized protein n=1 Tax=Ensete ventricosum TaxID=4639 RepID=A0A426XBQ3_ENSVE|nr:hypothetical protein B296_00045740 [Ensete ventricosum]